VIRVKSDLPQRFVLFRASIGSFARLSEKQGCGRIRTAGIRLTFVSDSRRCVRPAGVCVGDVGRVSNTRGSDVNYSELENCLLSGEAAYSEKLAAF